MDFPGNAQARGTTDEYLLGHGLLVAPVTRYKARSRSVYLPSGAGWYDFWSGKAVASGQREAEAPYDRIPLFVRAGSLLPFGPELQYIGEKAEDPITLYVYSGADGDLTLYEDDGRTYGYENGAFATIPFHWDEASQALEVGGRKGSFPGMLTERTFRVVLVTPQKPVGYPQEPASTQVVAYDGTKRTVSFGNAKNF